MSIVDRLAAPPRSRLAGVGWASAAAVMIVVGSFGWTFVVTASDSPETQLRVFLLGSVIALLGFVPLLRAVQAWIGRPLTPGWIAPAAFAVLLVRPLALLPEFIVLPVAFYQQPFWPFLFLATTGVAAGLVAVGWLPATPEARTPLRVAIVGLSIGLFVILTLFAFAPYVAPVSALGLALALSFRRAKPVNEPGGDSGEQR
jgi:hypothetical protein